MGQNRRVGFIALFTTIFCFGTLWTTAKISVDYLPPLWFTAGRFAIGGVFVAIVLHLQGRLRLPDKADVPIILSVGGIMLGLYSSIFQNALVFVHAGRATVLGYTTAIFVTPVDGEIRCCLAYLGLQRMDTETGGQHNNGVSGHHEGRCH